MTAVTAVDDLWLIGLPLFYCFSDDPVPSWATMPFLVVLFAVLAPLVKAGLYRWKSHNVVRCYALVLLV